MKCPPFDYVRAHTVEDVLTALEAGDGDAKILAGGQSLVPLLAMRLARPTLLVDVNRVAALQEIRRTDDVLEVGAVVRHRQLVEQHAHALLSEAAGWIGHTAIRSRGTAGGSVAHADPSAELPAVLLATNGSVDVAGASGRRSIASDDLFLGMLTTSLDDDEMITQLRFPIPSRWGFAEFARRHGDFALVSAVVAEVRGAVRVVLSGVGVTPTRVTLAEELIASGAAIRDVTNAVASEIDPLPDLHGGADFRRGIACEMVRRALVQAGLE